MEGKIELGRARKIASAIVEKLRPYCSRIEVAGSIRRRKEWCNDIDLVLVPKNLWELHHAIMGLATVKMSGSKIMRVEAGDIQIDIYFADEQTWATLLLIRPAPRRIM